MRKGTDGTVCQVYDSCLAQIHEQACAGGNAVLHQARVDGAPACALVVDGKVVFEKPAGAAKKILPYAGVYEFPADARGPLALVSPPQAKSAPAFWPVSTVACRRGATGYYCHVRIRRLPTEKIPEKSYRGGYANW